MALLVQVLQNVKSNCSCPCPGGGRHCTPRHSSWLRSDDEDSQKNLICSSKLTAEIYDAFFTKKEFSHRMFLMPECSCPTVRTMSPWPTPPPGLRCLCLPLTPPTLTLTSPSTRWRSSRSTFMMFALDNGDITYCTVM